MYRKLILLLLLALVSRSMRADANEGYDATADLSYAECWIDDNHADRFTTRSTAISIDVSYIAPGVHVFNYLPYDTCGNIGTLSRILFMIPEKRDVGDYKIVGYAYTFDSAEHYVSLPKPRGALVVDESFEVPSIKDCKKINENWEISIADNTITLSPKEKSITFSLRFLNEIGAWSEMYCTDIPTEEIVAHECIELPLNSTLRAEVPSMGDFVAFKIDLSYTESVTLKTTLPATVELYHASNGKIEKSNFSGEGFLEKGLYYGIAYNVDKEATQTNKLAVMFYDEDTDPAPEIFFADGKIQIETYLDGTIYYTVDGSIPTKDSNKYEGAFEITNNCTIKAVVIAGGISSGVATLVIDSFKVDTPVITVVDGYVHISCETPDAFIYYTMDGSDPSTDSAIYTTPIAITSDCTIKAVAVKDGYNDSDIAVAEITAPMQRCEAPVFALEGDILTIASATEGASIRYTIGGNEPNEESTLYLSPITLVDNRVVKAIACSEGMETSSVSEFTPSHFTCAEVKISYNGRMVRLTTATTGATIHYTVDGSQPTEESAIYLAEFDARGTVTINAIAIKDNFNSSEIMRYDISSYYDGDCATVATPGTLSQSFEWYGTTGISTLTVKGSINDVDIQTINTIASLQHLDISGTRIANGIQDNAFANTTLLTVSLPEVIESIGANVFANSKSLAAIIWNARAQMPEAVVAGLENPNLLIYVEDKFFAPGNVKNIVYGDKSDEITLVDAANCNFWAPISFNAAKISYTHNYSMISGYGNCAGWETISLPFNVEHITHASAGEIAPFDSSISTRHFWLYSLGESGFEPTSTISANVPYIISMPNNEAYAADNILAGDVTFSAQNVYIEASAKKCMTKGGFTFVSTSVHMPKYGKYTINKYNPVDGYLAGGGFVYELADVSPFECFFTHESGGMAKKAFGVFDLNDPTSAPSVYDDSDAVQIFTVDNELVIESQHNTVVTIHATSGILLQRVEVSAGITRITDMAPGIYIVNKQKVVIK